MQKPAKVTIKGAAESRSIPTKNGPKTVYEQPAQLETEGMRMQLGVSVDSLEAQHSLGEYLWDVFADIVPTPYGPELSRRMTLVPVGVAK